MNKIFAGISAGVVSSALFILLLLLGNTIIPSHILFYCLISSFGAVIAWKLLYPFIAWMFAP